MSENEFDPKRSPRLGLWLWLVFGALTLASGAVGFCLYHQDHPTKESNPVYSFMESVYAAIEMLIMEPPHADEGSNIFVEAGHVFGVCFVGITTWILLGKWLDMELRLLRLWLFWKEHYIVCGLGEKGMETVRFLKRDPRARVVIIDKDPDDALVDLCAELDVCVLRGDAGRKEILLQAKLPRAHKVIVITSEDETNVHIASEIQAVCAAHRATDLKCYVHLENIHLRERLQNLVGNNPGDFACALSFFDTFDIEARRVLASLPLDGPGLAADDHRSVHVGIIGFGRMGRSLALRAIKMGHFANHQPLRVSVIDRDVERHRDHFLFRYPALEKPGQELNCDLNFHQAEAESATARKLVERWAAESHTLLHLFVCVDANSHAIEVALRLQEALAAYPHCNLLVRIKAGPSAANILMSSPETEPRIQIFGKIGDRTFHQAFFEKDNEPVAQAIHADFVLKRMAGSNRTPKTDPALNDWENLREDLRESNRQQADHIEIKLRSIGCEMVNASDPRPAVTEFSHNEIEQLAEMEHARWNTERLLAGWRYGTPSNKAKRISEYICLWGDLDDSIQNYDRESVVNIPKILQAAQPPLKVVLKRPD